MFSNQEINNNTILFLNKLHKKNKNNTETIQEIINYFNNNNIDANILYDNRNVFLHSRRNYIIEAVYQLLTDNLKNYDIYVNVIKQILQYFISYHQKINLNTILIPIKENKKLKYVNLKYFNNDFILINQINFIYNNLPYDIIPFNKIYSTSLSEKIFNMNLSTKIINYQSFEKTKSFNNKFIFYCYICYFKSAINCIIHHPFYKNDLNINTLTSSSINGGSNNLWNLLSFSNDENANIINIIEEFNNLTNNKYLIGTPGIKYYPHQILQEILFLINNDFSNKFKNDYSYVYVINKHCNMNIEINNLLSHYNKKSLLIAPIINDPFVFNTFTQINNLSIKYNEINNITIKNINFNINNNLIYHYNYILNDFYLQSFCIIENIPLRHLSFHCIYIKLEYDENWNINKKIRYDFDRQKYKNHNEYKFMDNELNIFNETGINDYYDKNNNYKICLLCYVAKN